MEEHVCIPEIMNYEEISDGLGGVPGIASRIRVQECFKAKNHPNSSYSPAQSQTDTRAHRALNRPFRAHSSPFRSKEQRKKVKTRFVRQFHTNDCAGEFIYLLLFYFIYYHPFFELSQFSQLTGLSLHLFLHSAVAVHEISIYIILLSYFPDILQSN